eukprot:144011-Pelagomonas_calceolata.AAC.2
MTLTGERHLLLKQELRYLINTQFSTKALEHVSPHLATIDKMLGECSIASCSFLAARCNMHTKIENHSFPTSCRHRTSHELEGSACPGAPPGVDCGFCPGPAHGFKVVDGNVNNCEMSQCLVSNFLRSISSKVRTELLRQAELVVEQRKEASFFHVK